VRVTLAEFELRARLRQEIVAQIRRQADACVLELVERVAGLA